MWRLYGSPEETAHFDIDRLKQWLDDVLLNREQQSLARSPVGRTIFYRWVDTMLAQLRFNVISDFHERPPFGRRCNILQAPDPIPRYFLDRTGRDELGPDTDSEDWDEFLENHGLNVFAIALPRGKWHLSDWIK